MSLVPWWVLLSSGMAPVTLIGGWVTATSLQPVNFDPLTQTISSLAAYGATDRWLMTWVLVVVGVCYIATAYGLKAVREGARMALLCGGIASILVALSPEPVGGGTTAQHLVTSGVGFTALAIWPCLSIDRSPRAPWVLRPATVFTFTVVVIAGAAWFLFELHGHGAAGLAERVVTGLQALWPVIVVACLRRSSPYSRQPRRDVEHQTADG